MSNALPHLPPLPAIAQHKSAEEIEILRYVNRIGSQGHVAMMRAARPGVMEYQLEAAFLAHCYAAGGCRTTGYVPICGSGPNGAILHNGRAGAPNGAPHAVVGRTHVHDVAL